VNFSCNSDEFIHALITVITVSTWESNSSWCTGLALILTQSQIIVHVEAFSISTSISAVHFLFFTWHNRSRSSSSLIVSILRIEYCHITVLFLSYTLLSHEVKRKGSSTFSMVIYLCKSSSCVYCYVDTSFINSIFFDGDHR
jgi:hypothetical protein